MYCPWILPLTTFITSIALSRSSFLFCCCFLCVLVAFYWTLKSSLYYDNRHRTANFVERLTWWNGSSLGRRKSLTWMQWTSKLFVHTPETLYLYIFFPLPEPACSWSVCHLMECSLPACPPLAMVPSWKAPRHTHLACRLPLWSASPFVSTMLMKALSVSTARTPGCLLMSSLFDHYRHPAWTMFPFFFFLFFFFRSLMVASASVLYACSQNFVFVCVGGVKGKETRRRGLVSWLGLVYNKRGGRLSFKRRGEKKRKLLFLFPPLSIPKWDVALSFQG